MISIMFLVVFSSVRFGNNLKGVNDLTLGKYYLNLDREEMEPTKLKVEI